MSLEMRRYDANKDGTLSRTEFVEGRFGDLRFGLAPTAAEIADFKRLYAKDFVKLDKNGDGHLTLSELSAGQVSLP